MADVTLNSWPDLTADDWQRYLDGLRGSYRVRTQVEILDSWEYPQGDISDWLLDGQIDSNLDADVSRSLGMTLRAEGLDVEVKSASPRSIGPDNFIRITYFLRFPDGLEVPVPAFTGPIWDVSTDGATVEVSCQGKEALLLDPHLPFGAGATRPTRIAKGTNYTTALRRILSTGGEWALDHIPNISKRLRDTMNIGPEDERWRLAQSLAKSAGYLLYFDGMGEIRARRYISPVSFVFSEDLLLSLPTLSYSMDGRRNAVEVRYGERGVYAMVREESDAISAQSLSRRPNDDWPDGVPRYMVGRADGTDNGLGWARAEAAALMKAGAVNYARAFDAKFVPHLVVGEEMTVQDSRYGEQRFTLNEFSMPLVPSESGMSINYTRLVTDVGGIRVKGRKRHHRKAHR